MTIYYFKIVKSRNYHICKIDMTIIANLFIRSVNRQNTTMT